MDMVYRVPYEWIPQLEKQTEVEIEKFDLKNSRVKGTKGYNQGRAFYVI